MSTRMVSVDKLLSNHGIVFEVIGDESMHSMHSLAVEHHISSSNIIRSVIVTYNKQEIMLITSLSRVLCYKSICKVLGGDPLDMSTLDISLNKLHIPLPEAFSYQVYVDKGIFENITDESIYISGGDEHGAFKLKSQDYKQLISKCESLEGIGVSLEKLNSMQSEENCDSTDITKSRLKSRVDEVTDLPVMPAMTAELLRLRVNENSTAKDLSILVEQDPGLCAQIISWACSPYYGYKGDIVCIKDAIVKVLGFDLVLNLAVGVSVARSVNISEDNSLILKRFWLHSVYCATLMEDFNTNLTTNKNRLPKGQAYLSGLLHNLGGLLLVSLFKEQFFLLSKSILLNPDVDVCRQERNLYGLDHQQLCGWLMESWNMPNEIIASVRYHHSNEYDGDHSILIKRLRLINLGLSNYAIGDEVNNTVEFKMLMDQLQLDPKGVSDLFDKFWEKIEKLNSVVGGLVRA
ncbi:MAG: HDOD domain-containing protein [Francisellaceae bacterium]|jgi:HD-like signal output (HDOD) protein/prolyl-tRNA editing enzyme YbaK/EbsC (Cys-tRNA(Pro) deacylase)|nr:HDOD domain-containing protein [Francisellaceae bacterium]MBT6208055.1 HDOD domain-containing protein [Francisellaceae bacterium]MBT6539452.1 HDOD domain-containing protein [Francisellaceae bacterium]